MVATIEPHHGTRKSRSQPTGFGAKAQEGARRRSGEPLLLLVMLIVAMVDVPLQRFLHQSRMKMSHQEMKQESKESDGNPQMKGHMRQRQRDIAQGNSIKAVPKADFVLMNPTHYAVAIQYDEKTMHAPRVVSKGADLLAFKIRDLANEQHAIPVLQSPVLARALYAHAEIDQDIPSSLYTAVAQVLAYIYRLKAAMRGDGPMPAEVPVPFVPPELDPLSKVVAAAETHEPISTPQKLAGQQRALMQGAAAPMLVVAILSMMVLPLPPWLLDTFFTLNIAVALMVMMVAAYMIKPLDFAAFPAVLLLTTLMRLSLNVASTRVVLLEGHTGPGAAAR
jgi:type III secretion system FlhB-like substrate exporter